jgi:hypothetical protein
VENVGHVKAGNLAVEHRRRKKALSTLSDAGNAVTVERCKCMRHACRRPGKGVAVGSHASHVAEQTGLEDAIRRRCIDVISAARPRP